jgi:hypothetical protein
MKGKGPCHEIFDLKYRFEKVLTRDSGAQIEDFDEKHMSKISLSLSNELYFKLVSYEVFK